MKLNLDCVEPKFLEHTFKLDVVRSNLVTVRSECSNDFRRPNATVKVTFFVRIRFDVDRLLANLISLASQVRQPLALEFKQLRSVFLHHSLVVLVGDDRQAFWQQIVVCMSRLYFDNLTGFAKMLHVLDEHKLDAAIRAFWQTGESRCTLLGGFGRGHDEW